MRNYLAILAFLGVGVLSIFLMPRSVFGAMLCDGGVDSLHTNYITSATSGYMKDFCRYGSLDSATVRSMDVYAQSAGTISFCSGSLHQYTVVAGLNHIIDTWTSVASSSISRLKADCSNISTGVNWLKASWGSGTKVAMVFYDDEVGDVSRWTSLGLSSYPSVIGTYTGSTTRFVSFDSPQDEEATTTNVTLSGSYYLNSEDASVIPPAFGFVPSVELILTNTENATGTKIVRIPITVADSIQTFSTTTVLFDNSRYTIRIKITGNNRQPLDSGFFPNGNSFYQFTTGTFNPEDNQNYDLSSCNVLFGFDMGECLYGLIMPNPTVFSGLIGSAKSSYGRAVPMGYVTRFLVIVTSTSSSALPVISATVPNGIVGSGANISLDPNGVLDFVLNATTSGFLNSSASSTQTFYEITSVYWGYLIKLLFAVYIVRRIIGSHLIKL